MSDAELTPLVPNERMSAAKSPGSEPIDDANTALSPASQHDAPPRNPGANGPEQIVTVRECPKAGRDITLAYDTFGDSSDEPVLMIMGMNAQMILWPDDFCQEIASRGYFVVRFDNRDQGRSVHLDGMTTPSICNLICLPNCCAGPPPYALEDFALDAVALLDTLSIPKAHIVGQSMGGMIAQLIAINHPERAMSLWSIFSTPWHPGRKEPTLKVRLALAEKPRDDTRAEFQRTMREMGKVAFFPECQYEKNLPWIDDLFGRIHDRGVYVGAITRHAAAVVRQETRVESLKKVTCPTLVLHGEQDVLVDCSHGKKTHECVPGSELVLIPDMGHSTLPCHFVEMVDHWARVCCGGKDKKKGGGGVPVVVAAVSGPTSAAATPVA